MTDSVSAASDDLTCKFALYLDPHLLYPILSHALDAGTTFTASSIESSIQVLLEKFQMPDFYLRDGGELPESYTGELDAFASEAHAVLSLMEDDTVRETLGSDKDRNKKFLADTHSIQVEQIDALYHYGRALFRHSEYETASDVLRIFRNLSLSPALNASAQWGKLAADILRGDFVSAAAEIVLTRESIERIQSPPVALQQRIWLLHWSLFVFFNHPDGTALLSELFWSPNYLSTIQTSAPHLLRYLTAAALLQSPARDMTRLSSVVAMERYQYHDSMTDFILQLHTEFDFEAAQMALMRLDGASGLLANDFFLSSFQTQILDRARQAVGESYCRIHQRIDIGDLCQRLNLSPEDGEKWLVNLIKDTRLDGKIDYKQNTLTTTPHHPPALQTIIEKTRGLTIRSQALGIAIDRKAFPQSQDGGVQSAAGAGSAGNNKRIGKQSGGQAQAIAV